MQKFLILVFFLTTLPPRLSAQNRAQPVDGFAAEVDGRIITVGDVIERIRPALAQLSRQNRDASLLKKQAELFDEGLRSLIEQRLMIAQFNKMGAQLPASSVRQRRDTILRERFNNSEEELRTTLRKVGKTEQQWEEELREQMITQSMVQEFVRAKVHVSPREIREAYAEKKAELREDVELKLRSIAFRPVAEEEAAQRQERIHRVMKMLAEGVDFARIAKALSEGPKAAEGGDEGWVNLSRLPEELRDALEDVGPGEVTPLIETPTQSFIFKVEARRGGEILSLAQVQSALKKEIEDRKYEEIYANWIQGLYNDFQVRMFNPDISAVTGDL